MNCPNCRKENPNEARFCLNCGTPLTAQRSIEGERKFVTVLFADVVGSTSMGEELDPEQIAEIMNGAFACMNSAVVKYGGTVARLMGDAILAFFGAPTAHEDDPERAVRAALEIQEVARSYALEVQRDYHVDFNVRVGINTGLVVLAVVGNEIKTEYTAMGDTTNVASRLQSAAEPGSVLVSADTYRLVQHAFSFEPRGEIAVKGKSAPVETYAAIAPLQRPEKARGLEREGLGSALVGREQELRTLTECLDRLKGGQGSFVAVVGEAGLGKSRLIAELSRYSENEAQAALSWLEGRSISYGKGISYYPWRMIVRQSVDAHETDPPEEVRPKLMKLCDAECCILPGGDLPFLEAMLAVESEESLRIVQELQGDALVEHITNAIRGYICGFAQETPTVLIFDDLHWADDASLTLLENIADVVEQFPLLIICLLRSEKDSTSWHTIERIRGRLGEKFKSITLDPLTEEDSRHLLGNLLHIEALPESVRGVILARAEGNPFFVEEIIRSLVSSGHIVSEDGQWRAIESISSVPIPETLVGVLTARIDRLQEDTKRVAQMASVIGRLFPYKVLRAICEAAPLDERIQGIAGHLSKLVHDELIRERTHTSDIEYIFKHALTHEAVYNSLLLKRRKEFHQRAGIVLEAIYADRLDEKAPILAHHFWQAEVWERAVHYSLQAGRKALDIYALHEAAGHYERALEGIEKAPDASPEREIEAIIGWSDSSFQSKPYDHILQRLGQAEETARNIGDKRRLVQVLNWVGRVHFASGYTSRGGPALSEALALADELGDERLAIFPLHVTALMKVGSDIQAARAGFERAVMLANKYGDRVMEAYGLGARGLTLGRLGEFEEAFNSLRQALAVAEKVDNMALQADLHLWMAWIYLETGDVQQTLKYAELGLREAISANSFECICHGFVCLGFGKLQSQKLAEAAEAFQEGIRRSKQSGARHVQNMGQAGLALSRFFSGEVEVVGDVEVALEEATRANAGGDIALFSEVLGQVNAALGQHEQAEQYLKSAIGFYAANGMRPYVERAESVLAGVRGKKEGV